MEMEQFFMSFPASGIKKYKYKLINTGYITRNVFFICNFESYLKQHGIPFKTYRGCSE